MGFDPPIDGSLLELESVTQGRQEVKGDSVISCD